MKRSKMFYLFLAVLLTFPAVSAAHWIVGYVQNATDGTSPDGKSVNLWNPALGSDVISGLIGPDGTSMTNNVFMIDCQLLNVSCAVGDVLNVTVANNSDGHVGLNILGVTVTGAGFDVTGNLTMNSAPAIFNVSVDDQFLTPGNEIDLAYASNITINCTAVVEEYEGIGTLVNVTGRFYSNISNYSAPDDNNLHYTNNSCVRNDSYGGENQTHVSCSFVIEYYAEATNWSCTINATDEHYASRNLSDETRINTLLAIGVNSTIDFGLVNANAVTSEQVAEIINYGNVRVNLSLSGYSNFTGDGNSMWCDSNNITVGHMKYNLTSSNPGAIDLATANSRYVNLSSSPVINPFNLNNRQDDSTNDATNLTYWRVFVPGSVGINCQGNIVFGATT